MVLKIAGSLDKMLLRAIDNEMCISQQYYNNVIRGTYVPGYFVPAIVVGQVREPWTLHVSWLEVLPYDSGTNTFSESNQAPLHCPPVCILKSLKYTLLYPKHIDLRRTRSG